MLCASELTTGSIAHRTETLDRVVRLDGNPRERLHARPTTGARLRRAEGPDALDDPSTRSESTTPVLSSSAARPRAKSARPGWTTAAYVATAIQFDDTRIRTSYHDLKDAGDSRSVGESLASDLIGDGLAHVFVVRGGIEGQRIRTRGRHATRSSRQRLRDRRPCS